MDPEIKKLLDQLKAHAKRGEFLVAIRDNADYTDLRNEIYQVAYNDGVAAAEQNHKSAKTALQNQITTLEQERDRVKADLKKLKDENPDAAALHQQYGQQIAAKDQEIANLKAQHLSEKKDAKKKALRDAIEKELVALRVDPHKAAAAADASERSIIVDDNLGGRILQPGLSIAFAGDETAQVKALASEIFKTVPKTLIVSNVAGGGSAAPGETTGDGGTDPKFEALERAKAAALARGKAPVAPGSDRPLAPEEELNRRLGLRPRYA
jgi:hypothetical protein